MSAIPKPRYLCSDLPLQPPYIWQNASSSILCEVSLSESRHLLLCSLLSRWAEIPAERFGTPY